MKKLFLFLSLISISAEFVAVQSTRPSCPTTPPTPKGKKSLVFPDASVLRLENPVKR